MRTTINLDDGLLAEAQELAGPMERTALVHEALRALIEREASLRLATLGGAAPAMEHIPRGAAEEPDRAPAPTEVAAAVLRRRPVPSPPAKRSNRKAAVR